MRKARKKMLGIRFPVFDLSGFRDSPKTQSRKREMRKARKKMLGIRFPVFDLSGFRDSPKTQSRKHEMRKARKKMLGIRFPVFDLSGFRDSPKTQSRKHEMRKARKEILGIRFPVFDLSGFRDSHFRSLPGMICWIAWLVVAVTAHAQGRAIPETPVGVAGRVEQVVIPGPELEVVPHEDRKLPIRLRIVAVYPQGSAFRYDLEY